MKRRLSGGCATLLFFPAPTHEPSASQLLGFPGARNLFDGRVLAYYLVSTATFSNPLTRAPLTRGDCRRLDE